MGKILTFFWFGVFSDWELREWLQVAVYMACSALMQFNFLYIMRSWVNYVQIQALKPIKTAITYTNLHKEPKNYNLRARQF